MKLRNHVIPIKIVSVLAVLFAFSTNHVAAQRLVSQNQPTHKSPSRPQGSTPLKPQSGRVTVVRAVATPNTYTGTCPAAGKHVVFHGTITANGPAEVKYTWLRSDGATDNNPHELRFTAAGGKQVSDYWDVAESYTGWEALKVTAPNQVTSAHAAFRLSCAAARKPISTNPPRHAGQTPSALHKPAQ